MPYHPEHGVLDELDHNVVPVRRDGVELVRVTNASKLAGPLTAHTRSRTRRRRN